MDSSVTTSSGYKISPSGSFLYIFFNKVSMLRPVFAEILTIGTFSSNNVLYVKRFSSIFPDFFTLSTLFITIITGIFVFKILLTIHLSPLPAGSEPSTRNNIKSASGTAIFASSSKNSPSLLSGL